MASSAEQPRHCGRCAHSATLLNPAEMRSCARLRARSWSCPRLWMSDPAEGPGDDDDNDDDDDALRSRITAMCRPRMSGRARLHRMQQRLHGHSQRPMHADPCAKTGACGQWCSRQGDACLCRCSGVTQGGKYEQCHIVDKAGACGAGRIQGTRIHRLQHQCEP